MDISSEKIVKIIKSLQDSIYQQNITSIEINTLELLQEYSEFRKNLNLFLNNFGKSALYLKNVQAKIIELDLFFFNLSDKLINIVKNIKETSRVGNKYQDKLLNIQFQALKELNIDLLLTFILSILLDILEFWEEYYE
jgi:hypothetical protein